MPFANDKDDEAADDGLTLHQSLFEMVNTLCKIYPALTPFAVRKERARDVFALMCRIMTQPKTNGGQKVDKQGRILVPAGDDWF